MRIRRRISRGFRKGEKGKLLEKERRGLGKLLSLKI